jgi:hypothetical protein
LLCLARASKLKCLECGSKSMNTPLNEMGAHSIHAIRILATQANKTFMQDAVTPVSWIVATAVGRQQAGHFLARFRAGIRVRRLAVDGPQGSPGVNGWRCAISNCSLADSRRSKCCQSRGLNVWIWATYHKERIRLRRQALPQLGQAVKRWLQQPDEAALHVAPGDPGNARYARKAEHGIVEIGTDIGGATLDDYQCDGANVKENLGQKWIDNALAGGSARDRCA